MPGRTGERGLRGVVATIAATLALAGCPEVTRPNDDAAMLDGASDASVATFSRVRVSVDHSCAVRTDGALLCWGRRFGDGSDLVPTPQAVVLAEVDDVAVGESFACALRRDRHVWCWGANDFGQLGDGTRTTRRDPVQVADLDDVAQIAVGGLHACALRRGGSLWCWGSNGEGQLGLGTVDGSCPVADERGGGRTICPTARAVADYRDVITIALGLGHSCAVRSAGEVMCWGSNTQGQTGQPFESGAGCLLGSTQCTSSPSRVSLGVLSRASAVVGLNASSCAIDGGSVQCWGDWRRTLTGAPLDADPMPQPMREMTDAVEFLAMQAGVGALCVRRQGGAVACVGNNREGALALPAGSTTVSRFTEVPALRNLREIAIGRSHGCGVDAAGRVHCWGDNTAGQLGDGTMASRSEPAPIQY